MLINPYAFGEGSPALSAQPFYSSDFHHGRGWGLTYWPVAIQHSNKTYVAWAFNGSINATPVPSRKGIHIAAYDHGTETWSDRYAVGNFFLADDTHGNPALIRDADGYLHCFFGVHLGNLRYSVSTNPDDHTQWTSRPNFSGTVTYPHPVLIGSTIYLFERNDAVSSRRPITLRTATPSAGVATFSAQSTIIDLDPDSRAYMTEAYAVGTDIHFTVSRSNEIDSERKHIYYFVYDTVTGAVENYNGSTSVASGSLPVTLTQANASFRIFNSGSNDGAVASLAFDSSGDAHIIFVDGTSPTYSLKHMMLSGGAWSSPVTLASIVDRSPGGGAGAGGVSNYAMVLGPSGTMQAWYTDGDNISRRIRSSGGTWLGAQVMATPNSSVGLSSIASVFNAHSDLRVIFGENTALTDDVDVVLIDMYAYGDSGYVYEVDQTPVDSYFQNVAFLSAGGAFDGAASLIDDSLDSFIPVFSGNAQADRAESKFSQASLLFDGSGDFVSVPHSAAWQVGTGDFTFELWFRLNSTGTQRALLDKRPASGTSEWSMGASSTNHVFFRMWNGSTTVIDLGGTATLTTGVWYHVAACRSGSTVRLFLDGAIEASGTQSGSPTTNTQNLSIGRDLAFPGTRDMDGWIEEIRMTRAARYTAAFTAPAAPFPRR